ncbi:hypothetical protein [Cohnella abietis]|uniref:DUF4367 domain-containing protein n=1 Tax=Cohnella abietis TaxID=2507935 RepID=A0A3T1CYP7_9BACL|nr:hypothetical protein [Cohnella abietis]BBI30931.1 hypothetical protein KCTCHS21_03300 [Cohnella abietis]
MGRGEGTDSVKNLKHHSISDHQIEEINVIDSIMTRIVPLQSGGVNRSFRPAKRLTVYMTVLFIVLLASASVYAASEFIQIRNHAGDVKIQSVVLDQEAKITPYEKENSAPKPTYRDQVLELVKSGQVLAYYVRNSGSNPNIQFLHDTNIFTSYNDFKELLLRTSAPIIKEPTNLPDGFKFKYGSVMPILPNEYDDRTSAEHARLLELFQQRASAEQNLNLFVEEAKWSEANISELEYEKDSMNLRIQAMKNMIGMEIAFSSEFTQETMTFGGTEAIFAKASMLGSKSYEAVWYDENQDIHYHVTASGKVDLTEKQFKLIVENLVKG